jgi:hypothetical protein
MATVVKTIPVARAPEEAFAYIEDLEAHREWEGGVEEVRFVTDGPTGVGTEVEQTRVIASGQSVKVRWRVTEHDPKARRASYETVESPIGLIAVTLSVAPADGGSEVTCEMTATPPAEVGELIGRRMTRELKKSLAGDLGRLKERLEGVPAASSS